MIRGISATSKNLEIRFLSFFCSSGFSRSFEQTRLAGKASLARSLLKEAMNRKVFLVAQGAGRPKWHCFSAISSSCRLQAKLASFVHPCLTFGLFGLILHRLGCGRP
jgi:hypothetical protein